MRERSPEFRRGVPDSWESTASVDVCGYVWMDGGSCRVLKKEKEKPGRRGFRNPTEAGSKQRKKKKKSMSQDERMPEFRSDSPPREAGLLWYSAGYSLSLKHPEVIGL